MIAATLYARSRSVSSHFWGLRIEKMQEKCGLDNTARSCGITGRVFENHNVIRYIQAQEHRHANL